MTMGIYALWFEEPQLVYIGQSQSIEVRYKEHLRKLKNCRATNYKLQDCYNTYGSPELVILEEAIREDLNSKEISWQKEFNSLVDGLDLVEAGEVGWGPNSNSAKYSKRTIPKVFSLLSRTNFSYGKIAEIVNVNKGTVNDIKRGRAHTWLKEQYPKRYEIMQQRPRSMEKIVGPSCTFIDPAENIITIDNLAEFSRYQFPEDPEPFRKGLSKLRSGKLKTYKGWRLYK